MRTNTAIFAVSYNLAQFSAEDYQAFPKIVKKELYALVSDPIAYGADVHEYLNKTGTLKWFVFAISAKAYSWFFKRKRAARAAKLERLEQEAKKNE